jgi:hypothetical protein
MPQQKNLPLSVQEDSTMGNILLPVIKGDLKVSTMKSE